KRKLPLSKTAKRAGSIARSSLIADRQLPSGANTRMVGSHRWSLHLRTRRYTSPFDPIAKSVISVRRGGKPDIFSTENIAFACPSGETFNTREALVTRGGAGRTYRLPSESHMTG